MDLLTLNPLPDEKLLNWSKLKEIADDILKCIESEKKVLYRVETLWEKEKLVVTSNFSFSHDVFYSYKF